MILHDPDNQISSDADGDTVLSTDALIFDDAIPAGSATWSLELTNPFGAFEFLFEGENDNTAFGTPTFEIQVDMQSIGFTAVDYIENSAPINVTDDVSVEFVDSTSTGDFSRLRIRTGFPDGAEEQLTIMGETFNLSSAPGTIDVGGVTFNVSRFPTSGFGSGNGFDITLPGQRISIAQAEQIFESVQYSHTSEHPAAGVRTIGFQVVDQFVNNSREFSLVANAEINVVPVNDIPVAVDDGDILVAPGVPTVIDPVGINDFDVDLDPLTIVSGSSPHGTVVVQSDNTLVFTPDAGFTGTGNVSYTISDPFGATSTANVVVSDSAINQKPDAGTDQTLEGDENLPGGTVVATLGAGDPDGDPIIYRITEDTSNGLFVVSGDDLIVRPGTTLPDFEALGARTWNVTVRVTDPHADTDTVTITVNFNDIFEEIFLTNGNNNFIDRGDQGDTVLGLNGDDVIQGDTGDNRIHGDSPVDIIVNDLDWEETLVAGDLLSTLSEDGATGPVTYNVEDDPDGILEIVGNELRIKAGSSLSDPDGQQLTYSFALSVTDDIATHIKAFRANIFDVPETITATGSYVDRGAAGDDIIGTNANQTLRGDSGDGIVDGMGGNDNIGGGLGADELFGGSGNDTVFYDPNDTIVDGGSGTDNLRPDTGVFPLVLDTTTVLNFEDYVGTPGDDVIDDSGDATSDDFLTGDGADTVIAGAGNDRLFGQGDDDNLDGGAGNDQLFGDDGDDTLTGGSGNDTFYGGPGSDIFDAGAGNDNITDYNVQEDVSLDAGDGDDSVTIRNSVITGTFDLASHNVENVNATLLQTDSILDGSSVTGFNVLIQGGEGNDTITGSDLNDDLRGHDGDDVIDGGANNDTIHDGLGSDTLIGGDGNDIFILSDNDNTIDGGAGFDEVFIAADGVAVTLDLGATSIERINRNSNNTTRASGDDTFDASSQTERVLSLIHISEPTRPY